MKKPEILAPAGSIESLYAAVKSGCDAVYLGSGSFNARANAANFSFEELCEGVAYAHERGVKIYQTLNTVVFDSELPGVAEEIKKSALAGVDALIIQDLGVAHLVGEIAPEIEKHASTQMSLMNRAGLLQAAELGFTRGVLARELSSDELELCKNDQIEIEAFIHGALCMSVSGQCYMSVMLGGRSGNRGQCAQPCRLPFASGSNPNALSLKDMSLIRQMDELKALDIAALKIEGRMKRPEYVAAAVTACRKARDGENPDLALLEGIFSRSGFTAGYFNSEVDRDMFGIRRKEDVLASGDSLKAATQLYKDEYPHVAITVDAVFKTEELPTLTITDEDGNCVSVTGDAPTQKAINKPTTLERAEENLKKLGGTPYYIKGMNIELSPDCMMPVSVLNALRRDAVQQLSEIRRKAGLKTPREFTLSLPTAERTPGSQQLIVRLQNAAQYSESLSDSCDGIVMPYRSLYTLLSEGLISAEKAIVELPRVSFEGQHRDLDRKLEELRQMGVTKAVCHNLGMVSIAKKHGLTLMGGFGLNVTNTLTVAELEKIGFESCEISLEIPMNNAQAIQPILPKGIVAYGYLPNMTFRNCPIRANIGCEKCKNSFKTLTDRKGMSFSVDCAANGNAELFNSVPLYLADRIRELSGFDFLTLYFTKEDSKQVLSVLESYRNGTAYSGDKTRGIYYRGLTEL